MKIVLHVLLLITILLQSDTFVSYYLPQANAQSTLSNSSTKSLIQDAIKSVEINDYDTANQQLQNLTTHRLPKEFSYFLLTHNLTSDYAFFHISLNTF